MLCRACVSVHGVHTQPNVVLSAYRQLDTSRVLSIASPVLHVLSPSLDVRSNSTPSICCPTSRIYNRLSNGRLVVVVDPILIQLVSEQICNGSK